MADKGGEDTETFSLQETVKPCLGKNTESEIPTNKANQLKQGDEENNAIQKQLVSSKVIETIQENVGVDSTIGKWRRCCYTSILPFSLYSGFVGLITSALSSYLTSQVTTLEKQFGLSSSETGLLMSMNDAGFLCTVLFISHFGRTSHIPRVLAFCSFLYGISALICMLPHFITDNRLDELNRHANISLNPSISVLERMCSQVNRSANDACTGNDESLRSSPRTLAMVLISAGMFLQGISKSPRAPLKQTYIDDNVPKTQSGFYLGIVIGVSIFGPAVAYGIGGSISKLYVTLEGRYDPEGSTLVFGTMAIAISLPLCLFPKRLTTAPPLQEYKTTKTERSKSISAEVLTVAKDAFSALGRLVTRPIYVCFVIGDALRTFAISGVFSFTPKYLQIHYGFTVFKANIVLGFLSIGSIAIAALLSGVISRKLKLELPGMLKAVILTQVICSAVYFIGIFFTCPQPQIKDFDSILSAVSVPVSAENSSCLSGCVCDGAKFFPVCGSDGVNYFSPCHAGCQSRFRKGYVQCSCVSNVTSESLVDATPGMCKDECSFAIPFVVLTFCASFISGTAVVPAVTGALRSVDERDKSLAVGMKTFISSLVGWFLGPIVMGRVIDTTCILWNTSCSKRGSCAVYDIADLRYKLHGVDIGLSFGYNLLYVIAYILACRRRKENTIQLSNQININ